VILWIGTNGAVEVIDNVKDEPTLKQLYHWIGCDMIEVPGNGFKVEGEDIHFIVDEEGKIKDKPINRAATIFYNSVLMADPRGLQAGRDTLHGDVVVLTGKHLLK
jgi:hypothetical protein